MFIIVAVGVTIFICTDNIPSIIIQWFNFTQLKINYKKGFDYRWEVVLGGCHCSVCGSEQLQKHMDSPLASNQTLLCSLLSAPAWCFWTQVIRSAIPNWKSVARLVSTFYTSPSRQPIDKTGQLPEALEASWFHSQEQPSDKHSCNQMIEMQSVEICMCWGLSSCSMNFPFHTLHTTTTAGCFAGSVCKKPFKYQNKQTEEK